MLSEKISMNVSETSFDEFSSRNLVFKQKYLFLPQKMWHNPIIKF